MKWRSTLAAVSATVLVIAGAGLAAAKPSPAPVTATLKAKPEPNRVYCDECVRFSGRVSSPRPVCRANRTVEAALRYKPGTEVSGKTYHEDEFITTKGDGSWIKTVASIEPLAWLK